MRQEHGSEAADRSDQHLSRRMFVGRGALAAGVGGVGALATGALAPAAAEAAQDRHDYEFRVGDYGAVGNGRTDDTAAIQRCINAAVAYAVAHDRFARVLFEAKTYAIN